MDYTHVFIIICVCSFMYRIAEAEKRRGWLWGAIGLIWSLLLGNFINSLLLFFVSSFLLSYLTMFLANVLNDRPRRDW